MTLKEAQEKSVSGVAVLGNIVMQDVIWPTGSEYPYAYIQSGYALMKNGDRLAKRDDWEPLHPPKTPDNVKPN